MRLNLKSVTRISNLPITQLFLELNLKKSFTGFTELARRFPDDFKRLIQSFSKIDDKQLKSEKLSESFAPLTNSIVATPTTNIKVKPRTGICVKPEPPKHGKVKTSGADTAQNFMGRCPRLAGVCSAPQAKIF